jgi:hypothetical protein
VATLVTYPTRAHERAAAAITEFFAARDETDAVLLTNSCARGKATRDSCLDMQVVVQPHAVASMDHEFGRFASRSAEIADLHRAGRFSDLHLDVSDGVVTLAPITEEAISWSEVVVGTFFVYSVPLHVNGTRYESLRSEWLPFYDDTRRPARLDAARWFVLENNLARIPWYLGRELYFQAFDRFYRAFRNSFSGCTSPEGRIRLRTTSGSSSRSQGTSGCPTSTNGFPRCSSSSASRAAHSRRKRSHSPPSSTSTSANEIGPSSTRELGPHPQRYAAASSATSASTVSGCVTAGFDSMNTAATIAPSAASAAST